MCSTKGLFHFAGPVPLSIVEWCWICDKSFCPNLVCLLVLEFSLSVCPNCSPLIPILLYVIQLSLLQICLLCKCLSIAPLLNPFVVSITWAKAIYFYLQLNFKNLILVFFEIWCWAIFWCLRLQICHHCNDDIFVYLFTRLACTLHSVLFSARETSFDLFLPLLHCLSHFSPLSAVEWETESGLQLLSPNFPPTSKGKGLQTLTCFNCYLCKIQQKQ